MSFVRWPQKPQACQGLGFFLFCAAKFLNLKPFLPLWRLLRGAYALHLSAGRPRNGMQKYKKI
jgi:hypothetical protein